MQYVYIVLMNICLNLTCFLTGRVLFYSCFIPQLYIPCKKTWTNSINLGNMWNQSAYIEVPDAYFNHICLSFVDTYEYQGAILNEEMFDNVDIKRHVRALYCREMF